jgi:hypothetical protein
VEARSEGGSIGLLLVSSVEGKGWWDKEILSPAFFGANGLSRGLFGLEGAGVGVGMFVVVWRMVGLFDETASWSFIILPISSLASRIARSFAWVIFAGSLVI